MTYDKKKNPPTVGGITPRERCEAHTDADPCGPVVTHDVDGVPTCARCLAAARLGILNGDDA